MTGMTLKVLVDAFEAMEKAQSSDELRVQMARFARDLGFEHFAYALTVKVPSLKTQQYYINGFPPGWAERYLAQGYFALDPIVRHAERSAMPAVWTDESFHGRESGDFWEDAKGFGLAEGLSFAVHEQPGVTGIFSLARDQVLDHQGQDLAALVGRAQMFASLLHHAVARIDLPKLLPEQATALTERERECLRWTADGKTAWEIGKILSIAERTVVFHINNVVQKLGAANKTQAIVRAVALRLV
jgi:LuxR family transcriptional regulator, quorum-sensing system regulator SolR